MAGPERLFRKTGLGRSDRFVTEIIFRGHRFIDPMKTGEYAENLKRLTAGNLSLRTFEVSGHSGYGASPAEGTGSGEKK